MIILSAHTANDTAFLQWAMVNRIILPHVRHTDEWKARGYDGINPVTQALFGFSTRRNSKSYVEFVFDTDEDYVYFKLKWH